MRSAGDQGAARSESQGWDSYMRGNAPATWGTHCAIIAVAGPPEPCHVMRGKNVSLFESPSPPTTPPRRQSTPPPPAAPAAPAAPSGAHPSGLAACVRAGRRSPRRTRASRAQTTPCVRQLVGVRSEAAEGAARGNQRQGRPEGQLGIRCPYRKGLRDRCSQERTGDMRPFYGSRMALQAMATHQLWAGKWNTLFALHVRNGGAGLARARAARLHASDIRILRQRQ